MPPPTEERSDAADYFVQQANEISTTYQTRLAAWQALLEQLTGLDPRRCPACGTGQMVIIERLSPQPLRAPPDQNQRVA